MSKTKQESPSPQEQSPTSAGPEKAGRVAVSHVLDDISENILPGGLETNEAHELVTAFRENPVQSLAHVRQELCALYQQPNLGEQERTELLTRHLRNYASLIVTLDHEAFGATDDGTVHRGVPGYIPDRFIDMGRNPSLDSQRRDGRDQIRIDKAAIINRYNDTLMDVFTAYHTTTNTPLTEGQIVTRLLLAAFNDIPYDYESYNNNGSSVDAGVVNLHELSKGLCRHKVLIYEVLAQACGLESRLLKCHVNGGRHAANATFFDGHWYLTDPTIADYATRDDGTKLWRPNAVKLDHQPNPSDILTIHQRYSSDTYVYRFHDDMYWRLDV
ncbi:hypothetical protein EOL96_03635 [Candidatus Saccharibacteria bacterium]|nr:hypothetical protein [Candidatus Saccharibacteria bacterium]